MAAPVVEDVKRLYKLAWWAMMIRGLFAIAVGAFIFVRPLDSVAALALVIAFWALFGGVVEIVQAVHLRQMAHWWVLLLAGLVSAGFGVAALYYYPTLALAFAVAWFAWWLLLTGFLGTFAAVQLKRLGMDWVWPAAFGVLSIVAGVFALMSPPATLSAIMGLIAGFAIVGGALQVGAGFKVRSIVHA
ncbi:MAG TPA: DUF308 domain-containing protein [Gemmatimonadales bacterium]|nr:DUF308 domain-containing protein [Gemmatimonadales bacterium]